MVSLDYVGIIYYCVKFSGKMKHRSLPFSIRIIMFEPGHWAQLPPSFRWRWCVFFLLVVLGWPNSQVRRFVLMYTCYSSPPLSLSLSLSVRMVTIRAQGTQNVTIDLDFEYFIYFRHTNGFCWRFQTINKFIDSNDGAVAVSPTTIIIMHETYTFFAACSGQLIKFKYTLFKFALQHRRPQHIVTFMTA